jgi:hypothetical protein
VLHCLCIVLVVDDKNLRSRPHPHGLEELHRYRWWM